VLPAMMHPAHEVEQRGHPQVQGMAGRRIYRHVTRDLNHAIKHQRSLWRAHCLRQGLDRASRPSGVDWQWVHRGGEGAVCSGSISHRECSSEIRVSGVDGAGCIKVGKEITVQYFSESRALDRGGASLRFPRVKKVWEEGRRDI